MTTTATKMLDITAEELAELIDLPIDDWHHNCHGVSLAIVRAQPFVTAGVTVPLRVARGWTMGQPGGDRIGQHSWVVCGWVNEDDPDDVQQADCYDPCALILDASLWSYDDRVPKVLWAQQDERPHQPHGWGSIWDWGRPPAASDEPVELPEPTGGWSGDAGVFLKMIGPLDVKGWRVLAHAPVDGWPAGEILTQMAQLEEVRQAIPIDVLGMATDINPGGLYLPRPS